MAYILKKTLLGFALIALASSVLLFSDAGRRAPATGDAPRTVPKTWKIKLLKYVEIDDSEEAERGALAGLKEAGLKEGSDYEVTSSSANGDMATVSGMVDAAVTEGADLLLTLSTPTLQAALSRGRGTPLVFSFVADAVAAGAGKSDSEHLPNVTGVYIHGAYAEVVAALRECLPRARKVGTLFVPTEVNTVFHKDMVIQAGREAGIEVIALPVTSSSEISDAAMSLCSREIDALCQVGGNLLGSSFTSIARAARQAKLPVFAFLSTQARQGAAVVVSRDYYDGGREAGLLAARIIRGEDPSAIPFEALQTTRTIVNLEAARQAGLEIPKPLLDRASEVIGK